MTITLMSKSTLIFLMRQRIVFTKTYVLTGVIISKLSRMGFKPGVSTQNLIIQSPNHCATSQVTNIQQIWSYKWFCRSARMAD